jgi:hypothetical protein
MLRLLALALALGLAWPARAESPLEAAVEALRHDSSLKVRTQAALVLGQRGAPEAVPALRQAVAEDSAASVRLAAVGALAKLGARVARPTLQAAALADADASVRAAAARALAGLGPVALRLEEGGGTPSARAWTRQALAAHLARLGLTLAEQGEVRVRPTTTLEVNSAGGKTVVAVRVSLSAVDGDGRVELLEGTARATVAGELGEARLAAVAARALEAATRGPCEDLATRLGRR